MARILFDTNIFLDVLCKRPGLYLSSSKAMKTAFRRKDFSCAFVSSLKDIFYLAKKDGKEYQVCKEYLCKIVRGYFLVSFEPQDAYLALESEMKDYEDAIIAEACCREGIDLIITRNVKDFIHSKVPAITPEEYLQKAGNPKSA